MSQISGKSVFPDVHEKLFVWDLDVIGRRFVLLCRVCIRAGCVQGFCFCDGLIGVLKWDSIIGLGTAAYLIKRPPSGSMRYYF